MLGDKKRNLYSVVGEAFISGLIISEGIKTDIYSREKLIVPCVFL
jgi:hypothetical protein